MDRRAPARIARHPPTPPQHHRHTHTHTHTHHQLTTTPCGRRGCSMPTQTSRRSGTPAARRRSSRRPSAGRRARPRSCSTGTRTSAPRTAATGQRSCSRHAQRAEVFFRAGIFLAIDFVRLTTRAEVVVVVVVVVFIHNIPVRFVNQLRATMERTCGEPNISELTAACTAPFTRPGTATRGRWSCCWAAAPRSRRSRRSGSGTRRSSWPRTPATPTWCRCCWSVRVHGRRSILDPKD